MDNSSLVHVGLPITAKSAVLMSTYSIVLVVGLAGNLWVARVLGTVLLCGRNVETSVPRSVQLLIFALCLSDLLLLFSMVLMLVEMFFGQWVFGYPLCIWFIFCDMLNKFFAPFLLAVLSTTFYFFIANPTRCHPIQKMWFAASAIATSFIGAVVVIAPALWNTQVITYELEPKLIDGDYQTPVVRKCGFRPDQQMSRAFAFYGTVLGYLMPMFTFCFFYIKLLFYVRGHNRRRQARTVPLRVGKMIMALILVYICCWTPFWVGTWVALLTNLSNWQVMLIYITHLLPYISCTAYPVIYTLMNRDIQNTHARIVEQQRMRKLTKSEFSSSKHSLSFRSNRSGSSFRSSSKSFLERGRKLTIASTGTADSEERCRAKSVVSRNSSSSPRDSGSAPSFRSRKRSAAVTTQPGTMEQLIRKLSKTSIQQTRLVLLPKIDIEECSSNLSSSQGEHAL